MSEVISFSTDSLNSYPSLKKHIFNWVGGLTEADARNQLSEIRSLQGRFLKSARVWRSMEIADISRLRGISVEVLEAMESGHGQILASDWMSVAFALNIQDDAEMFVLLLENAFDEKKRKARKDLCEAMSQMGFGQLKSMRKYQRTSPTVGASVISFHRQN